MGLRREARRRAARHALPVFVALSAAALAASCDPPTAPRFSLQNTSFGLIAIGGQALPDTVTVNGQPHRVNGGSLTFSFIYAYWSIALTRLSDSTNVVRVTSVAYYATADTAFRPNVFRADRHGDSLYATVYQGTPLYGYLGASQWLFIESKP